MAKYATITLRRDSTLNWYAANPRLALGEVGVDMNLLRFKVGNGIDKWNELPYMNDDLYTTLDSRTQEITDKISSILETIRTNREQAERGIATLGSRMTTLETRQSTYERNLTAEFQEVKDALDAGLLEFMETRDNLTTRMDVIVGSATEDTEILDARVDALYETHPNLGHNIRSLHSQILDNAAKEAEDIASVSEQSHKEIIEVDEKLQSQIDKNAEANIQNAINLHEKTDRDRESFSTLEAEAQILRESIQSEIDSRTQDGEAIKLDLETEVNSRIAEDNVLSRAIHEVDSKLEDEARERLNADSGLAKQANDNANANLQNALNIVDFNNRHEKDLRYEADQRIQCDGIIQGEIDKLTDSDLQTALNLHYEAEQRRKLESKSDTLRQDLTAEARTREAEDARLDGKITLETNTRAQQFAELQDDLDAEKVERQAQDESIKQDITRKVTELKADITAEEQARIEADDELDDKITAEAESRVSADKNLQEQIDDEAQERLNVAQGLAKQANDNATANLRNTFKILDVDTKHKESLAREEAARVSDDNELQRQIDINAEAEITNALSIHQETDARQIADDILGAEIDAERINRQQVDRELTQAINAETDSRIAEDNALRAVIREVDSKLEDEAQERLNADSGLAKQANDNATANLQNALNILAGDKRIQKDLSHEIEQRIIHDEILQSQVDENSSAGIQNALNIKHEAEKRRELSQGLFREYWERHSEDSRIKAKLNDEIWEREFEDKFLQEQITTNDAKRIEGDRSLQSQVDNTSSAALQNALTIRNEIEQRRQLLARLIEEKQDREHAIQNLLHEIGQLYEIPLPSLNADLATLQKQADHNAQANISNALNIQAESIRRRENISHVHKRISATHEVINEEFSQLYALGAAHQSQLDELANAVMQSVFNLLNEVSRRKAAINREATARITHDEGLAGQIDLVADGVIQNALTLNNSNEKRRFEDFMERLSRCDEDNGLQSQINTLSTR